MKPKILIVEDEAALVTLLRYNLERDGYEVAEAGNGEEALLAVEETPPDLILLDWMLPLTSGIEVCRQLRRKPETRLTPIIMLTARGEEGDKIRGLDSGADDYVTKPFSPAELLARIRSLIRRSRPAVADETLQCGDLSMDLAAHKVRRGDRNIHLGPTEFRLLRHLMEHQGRVFSREQLLDTVWGRDIYVEVRTVDVHIRRLRKAINGDGEEDFIRTVRAAGYAIESPDLMRRGRYPCKPERPPGRRQPPRRRSNRRRPVRSPHGRANRRQRWRPRYRRPGPAESGRRRSRSPEMPPTPHRFPPPAPGTGGSSSPANHPRPGHRPATPVRPYG